LIRFLALILSFAVIFRILRFLFSYRGSSRREQPQTDPRHSPYRKQDIEDAEFEEIEPQQYNKGAK